MSGVIDLQTSPNNYNLMFASSWTKDRKAWNFDGSGNNSGIYKSTDAGNTWTKISTENSGFPTGQGVEELVWQFIVIISFTLFMIVNSEDHPKTKRKPPIP